VARGTAQTISTLIAVPVIAVGVPALWVWLASQIAGSSSEVTPSLAIFITAGIMVSYWVALLIGSALRRRWVPAEEERKAIRRMSWNRSFRDEPHRSRNIDPVERIFVITAVVGFIAFEVWFFFFAGSPLPNQPLF
jgi:multidrug efflux pump subunit AcrB